MRKTMWCLLALLVCEVAFAEEPIPKNVLEFKAKCESLRTERLNQNAAELDKAKEELKRSIGNKRIMANVKGLLAREKIGNASAWHTYQPDIDLDKIGSIGVFDPNMYGEIEPTKFDEDVMISIIAIYAPRGRAFKIPGRPILAPKGPSSYEVIKISNAPPEMKVGKSQALTGLYEVVSVEMPRIVMLRPFDVQKFKDIK